MAVLLAACSPFERYVAVWAPSVAALAGFVAWGVWLHRPARPSRERWMIGVAFCAAVAVLGFFAAKGLLERIDRARTEASPAASPDLLEAYRSYWRELELRAAGAVRDFGADPAALRDPARAFVLLDRVRFRSPIEGLTLLLVDADREVVAWSGDGLLRDPTEGEELRVGRFARQSHAAATVWLVQALEQRDAAGAALWVVAGESRSLSAAPPLIGASRADRERVWRFADASSASGWVALSDGERPALQIGARRAATHDSSSRTRGPRLAALFAGFGLLGLAALRGLALGVLSGTVVRPRSSVVTVTVLLLAAVVAIGAGFGAEGRILAGLPFALGLALAAGRALREPAGPEKLKREKGASPWGERLRFGAPLLVGAAIASLAFAAPASWPDLAESSAFDPSAAALRLGLAAALFAGLAVAPGRAGRARSAHVAWVATSAALLLGVAAATHDQGPWALVALAGGLLAAGRSSAGASWRRPGSLLPVLLLALFGSAVAWQWGARSRLAEELPGILAPLAPPSDELLTTTEHRLERHFRAFDLAALAPGGVPELDPIDLAYTLWRESPLARLDAASALVVEPRDGPLSSFSFGLPLDDRDEIDRSPARWQEVAPSAWRALERTGDGSIVAGGSELGTVRWWLVPHPGFGVRDAEIRDLPTTLLGAKRSSELAAARALLLPAEAGVSVVIYDPNGEIELSPWREGTPSRALLRSLSIAGRTRVDAPGGPARFALREAPGTTLALLAPVLSSGEALERVGAQFAGALFVAALFVAAGALLALPRATARDLAARTFRSYSKRLILVYSLLLLMPLLLLYALLSQSLGQRVLREQRLAAQAALSSAQRVLGEYVLSLEPGFGVDTALDDELLVWLSRVVGHEIHLYWNGEVYASSQPELFAAGFLNRRVPGEIWRGAAYGGERLMTRTTRAGEARYVELYAPLLVPGIDPRASRLLLSMPLLAQQEEATAETARIRRRTLLATLAAFLLLAAIGVRLARSFTRPITDLVAGTQRIAAGAPSLGVSPRVDELSALAEAIDLMARRIAEGRDQLMREKKLVEGIVDSVTSGVVGVDRSGRVLLANRVARQLLDVEPGERLLERLALRPELADIRRFVAAAADTAAQGTARAVLTSREERDWSLVWVPLSGPEEPGGLLVVEDVSEVLRAQRLEAWAAMARLIAHEIKNPLTPIRLSTEHLRDAWSRDRAHFESVFERCTVNILRQVDELRDIASEFSIYSRIPKSERVAGDLVTEVRGVVEGYRAAPPPGVEIEFLPESPGLEARFDARLLGRAVRNLVENALRVSTSGGRVTIRVGEARASGSVWIEVADQGPGVPDDQLSRIFEPYFSTHSGGTGLGLPIALRVAEEHGGTIRARNRPAGGLEVTITIPRE